MPTIPYRTEFDPEAEAAAEVIRRRRPDGLLNLDRMLLHSPALAEGWSALVGRLRQGRAISARHRELAICAVAVLTGADYEYHHHAPLLAAAGASPGQIEALSDVAAAARDAALFDAADRAVLALALDSTLRVRPGEATLAAVRSAFPAPGQVVELMLVIAAYNMVARFLVGLGVEVEGQEA